MSPLFTLVVSRMTWKSSLGYEEAVRYGRTTERQSFFCRVRFDGTGDTYPDAAVELRSTSGVGLHRNGSG